MSHSAILLNSLFMEYWAKSGRADKNNEEELLSSAKLQMGFWVIVSRWLISSRKIVADRTDPHQINRECFECDCHGYSVPIGIQDSLLSTDKVWWILHRLVVYSEVLVRHVIENFKNIQSHSSVFSLILEGITPDLRGKIARRHRSVQISN